MCVCVCMRAHRHMEDGKIIFRHLRKHTVFHLPQHKLRSVSSVAWVQCLLCRNNFVRPNRYTQGKQSALCLAHREESEKGQIHGSAGCSQMPNSFPGGLQALGTRGQVTQKAMAYLPAEADAVPR